MVNKPTKNNRLLANLKSAGIGGKETRTHNEWVEWQKNNPEDGNCGAKPRIRS